MQLTPEDIRTLRDWKAWMRTNAQKATVPQYVTLQPPRMVQQSIPIKLIKAPSGGIPGRVGTLLGSVECDVWNEDNTTEQIKDSTQNITVYNWTTSAICSNGDRYGLAGWCNGGWYIIAEDCNDEGTATQPGVGSGTVQPAADAIDTVLTPTAGSSAFYDVRYSSTSTGGGFE